MNKTVIALALLTTFTGSAMAAQNDSPWLFRVSVAHISPNDSSGSVLGNDGVTVESSTAIGLNLAYMFDENWGVEILGATPFRHNIKGTGALAGLDIGSTKQLPPTLSVLYEWGHQTKYHVGLGVNYTEFFDSHTNGKLTDALGADTTDLELDSSTGISLKAGFDYPISDDWSFSGTVYYMKIDTTADVIVNGQVAAKVDVDIDPLIFLLGFSTRF